MAVNLSPVGGVAAQFFNNSGYPLTGGKLYSYAAGTTTPATTYTSSSGATAHSNPIILDAAGRVPAGGEIWLTAGVSYKFLLKTSADVLIGTYDNIDGINEIPNADVIPYDPPFTGAVQETVAAKLSQTVSVKDFGAVGDGIADDTAAIQAALNAAELLSASVLVPSGTYLVTGLLTANASLVFNGGVIATTYSVKLNGKADLLGSNGGGFTFGNSANYIGRSPNFYDTQILCGLDATWTGKINGVTFRVDNIDYCYLISLWNCSGAEVSGNHLIDFHVNIGGSLIGAPNSSTGITGTNTRSQVNCRVTNNDITFTDALTGAQLFGAYQSNGISFTNNVCYGGGDDIINADRSTGLVFNNNYISTRVGNILINNTQNFSIVGNVVVKENVDSGYAVRATYGGIQLIPTDPTQTFVAKNGVVSNNTVVNNSAYDMTQPMLIAGVENVIVTNNVLVNNKADANFVFQVTNSASVVPALSPTIYNKNLIVKDNLVVNGKILMSVSGGTSNDGVIAIGNVSNAGGYGAYSMNLQGFSTTRNDYAVGNIGIGATSTANNLINDGIGFDTRTLLNVFTATSVTATTNLKAVGSGAYLYAPSNIVLDQITIQFSAATSAACVIRLYTYDGVSDTEVGTWTLGSGTKSKNATATDEGVKLSTVVVPSGHAVKLALTTTGLTSVDLSANLYGSKFVFS